MNGRCLQRARLLNTFHPTFPTRDTTTNTTATRYDDRLLIFQPYLPEALSTHQYPFLVGLRVETVGWEPLPESDYLASRWVAGCWSRGVAIGVFSVGVFSVLDELTCPALACSTL